LVLLVSFYLLAQVSDKYFVVSLDKIAENLKMSHDMAGATLMAIGSSAPELFVALIALFKEGGGHEEIGIGTIVGSALFNILAIIGAAAFVRKAVLVWQPVLRDIMFYMISIIALWIVFNDGLVTFYESLSLISLYVLYIIAVAKWRKILPFTEVDFIEEDEGEEENKGWKVIFIPFDFILGKFFPATRYYVVNFFISIIMIAVLSWVLVDAAIHVSRILNVPEVIIALTVLAVGTSIPDLISSIIVARQGRAGMAVSNAIGSNIFDIMIGLGLPWALVYILRGHFVEVKTEGLMVSIALLFASVIFIFLVLVVRKWRMGPIVGATLISLYLLYLVWSGVSI
ncbi:MAG: calcium/sodium antiporter, partial [Cyclobacteriaceae bacterium]|nr:calcium/sodium antiporter [Cyclobacteriaceae bacterium]